MSDLILHLPLIKKTKSESQNCLFLAQENNIFCMDNHLMALWCWQYFFKNQAEQYNFFHLDAHEDAKADLNPTLWETIQGLSLNEYLALKSEEGNYKLFRWDNYLPVFVHPEQKLIRKSVFATHNVGLAGFCHQRISPYNLLTEFSKLFVDELPWVINLDFDYFFAREYKENFLFDKKWIEIFFKKLKDQYDQNDIKMITIALSPECCGSWNNAEKILALFDEIFKTQFSTYLKTKF